MNNNNTSKYYTDENVVRLIAAQVIIIAALSLWQGWFFLLFLLSADFALRAFTYQPSPLALIAKLAAARLNLEPKPIFAAPKKFAASLGFVFSLTIAVLLYLDYAVSAYTVGGILVFFAFLESALKICVGCYAYNWMVAPIVNRRNKS